MVYLETRPGWPTYPRIARPHQLRPATALATLLTENLRRLSQGEDAYQKWNNLIAELTPNHPTPEMISASYYAARIIAAEKVKRVLVALNDPCLLQITVKIEKQARELMPRLPVGNFDAWSYIDMYDADAISTSSYNEISYRHRQEGILEVISRMTFQEIRNEPLLKQLLDSPEDRQNFIAERSARNPDTDSIKVIEELFGLIKKLHATIGNIDLFGFFYSPRYALAGELSEDHRKALHEEQRKISNIELFLSHDIAHTFGSALFNAAYKYFTDLHAIPISLYPLSRVTAHLNHFRNILRLNYFRLTGELPIEEPDSLRASVEAAVWAAAYRWHISVNSDEPAQVGKINYYIQPETEGHCIPAFINAIVYNLIKNSLKASVETEKIQPQITVRVRKDTEYPEITLIEVNDHASGFNLNRLARAALKVSVNPENSKIISEMPVFAKLRKWNDLPHIFRTLTAGEIMDLAFIAKISGFSDKSISSGLGLAEVAEIAQVMEADILMTNQSQGGALVTLIMGSKEAREKIIARELWCNPS